MLTAESVTVKIASRALLQDVSLAVHPGELLAILGENGAGKSTLLKTLTGDLQPSAGTVTMNGRRLQDWTTTQRARARAVLAQETHLSFAFDALQIALLGRYPHCDSTPAKRDVEIALAALALVGCAHLQSQSYPTLSGGERARVQLARVLAQVWENAGDKPSYLLLDEPVASLDLAHRESVLGIARDLAHERGLGVVAILHDLNLAAIYADRVALMKDGRLRSTGRTDDVLRADVLSDCFGIPIRSIDTGAGGCVFAVGSAGRGRVHYTEAGRIDARGPITTARSDS